MHRCQSRARALTEHPKPDIRRFGENALEKLQTLCAMANDPPDEKEWNEFYSGFIDLIFDNCSKYYGNEAGKLSRRLLREIDSLWVFLEVAGVEPTNNATERGLRFGVLWRKRSQGSGRDELLFLKNKSPICRGFIPNPIELIYPVIGYILLKTYELFRLVSLASHSTPAPEVQVRYCHCACFAETASLALKPYSDWGVERLLSSKQQSRSLSTKKVTRDRKFGEALAQPGITPPPAR